MAHPPPRKRQQPPVLPSNPSEALQKTQDARRQSPVLAIPIHRTNNKKRKSRFSFVLWGLLAMPMGLAAWAVYLAYGVVADRSGTVSVSETVVVGGIQQVVHVEQTVGAVLMIGDSRFTVGEVVHHESQSWRGRITGRDGDKLQIEVLETESSGAAPTHTVGEVLRMSPAELLQPGA